MIGCEFRRLDHCESTNDEAARWARQSDNPAPAGAVVIAESQSAGRGRRGRQWHSPAGENLYFSCILRPPLQPHQVPPITLCAGLAVCQVVNSLGVAASIKWPNDVLVGPRKLAGVLTEMSTQSQKLDSVVVGVGVNVNMIDIPSDLSATSIRNETGKEHDRAEILGSILFAMDEWVQRYCSKGVTALVEAFESSSMLGGREVRAVVSGELIAGRVVSLGEEGSLIVRDHEGVEHRVIAGEVQVVDNRGGSQA